MKELKKVNLMVEVKDRVMTGPVCRYEVFLNTFEEFVFLF